MQVKLVVLRAASPGHIGLEDFDLLVGVVRGVWAGLDHINCRSSLFFLLSFSDLLIMNILHVV